MPAKSVTGKDGQFENPVVEFAPFHTPVGHEPGNGQPTEAQRQVAKQLDDACRLHGFVFLRNTGIPGDVIEKAFRVSKALFDLPDEHKKNFPETPRPSVEHGLQWFWIRVAQSTTRC